MGTVGRHLRRRLKTWRAVDVFCVLWLLATTVLIVVFPARVRGWWLVVLANLVAVISVDVFRRFANRSPSRGWRFFCDGFLIFVFIWLWAEVGMLQQVLYGGKWFDQVLINFEYKLFGVHPILWLERFVSIPVTEWMLWGYFGYLPVIPLVAAALFFQVNSRAMDTYLFAMAVGFVSCYVVFLFFPVAAPRFAFEGLFTRDLDGHLFRWLCRLIERYGHFPGGSFPSAHCAAGTVMLMMSYKYHRRTFYLILPVIGTFYIATVYGRYHYVSDTVAGIIVGAIIACVAPKIEVLWQRFSAGLAA